MFFWKKENKRKKMDHEEGEGLGKNTWLLQRNQWNEMYFVFLTVGWNEFFFFYQEWNEFFFFF